MLQLQTKQLRCNKNTICEDHNELSRNSASLQDWNICRNQRCQLGKVNAKFIVLYCTGYINIVGNDRHSVILYFRFSECLTKKKSLVKIVLKSQGQKVWFFCLPHIPLVAKTNFVTWTTGCNSTVLLKSDVKVSVIIKLTVHMTVFNITMRKYCK